MAQQHLKPVRTKEEARERGRRGGIKSGEARREKKTFKQTLLLLLEEVNPETGKTRREEINDAIMEKAMCGDTKAFEIIRDTVGEKPTDKVEQSGEVNSIVTIKTSKEVAEWGK